MSKCRNSDNGVVAPANFESSKCRSGCTSQDHANWGDCMRSANVSTMVGGAVQANRTMETDLAEYRKVRKQGIQPKSVKRSAVEAAKKVEGL